jgi:hypothetical protein
MKPLNPLWLTFIICIVFRLCGGGYPQSILDRAAEFTDNNERVKSLYFPLYNKILHYWFPSTGGYNICPYWVTPDTNKPITFVVEYHHHPLLFIEVKAPSDFKLDSRQNDAIIQVNQHLDEIGPTIQLADRLYAISAIGKRWRACYTLRGKGSKGGQPVNAVAEASSLVSNSEACWNPDITSDGSWAALQSIVETVHGYVAHAQ